MDATTAFYEDLAAHFHLLFEDWDLAVREQGALLGALIGRELGPGPKRVLDAACGIGTQAIGLARNGHAVTGSDLSPTALARARREAARFSVEVRFQRADFRDLARSVSGSFDVVCALDNALAHAEDPADLAAILSQMTGRLAPGGLVLLSFRDYDALLADRPTATPERIFDEAGGRRRVFQLWDWQRGARYRYRLCIVRETGGANESLVFEGRSRAITRAEATAACRAAGLDGVRWLMPEESGYYQPLAIARKPVS